MVSCFLVKGRSLEGLWLCYFWVEDGGFWLEVMVSLVEDGLGLVLGYLGIWYEAVDLRTMMVKVLCSHVGSVSNRYVM